MGATAAVLSADFINDIVIVCTLAILIGQNLCGNISIEVDNKRRDLRNYLEKIDSKKEIIKDENITKLYDQVKNFSLRPEWYFDTIFYMRFFYCYILGCVLLDIISLNRNTGNIDLFINFPVETCRFYFEIIIWVTLAIYGYILFRTRQSYDVFNQNLHNLQNGLLIAESFYSPKKRNNPKTTDK